MTAGTTLLSRFAAIEPGAISQQVIDKAGRLVAEGRAERLQVGPGRAVYQVQGDTATYIVRLDLTVRVWSGACSHFDALHVPQQRRAPICSHILAAAYAMAEHLGLSIPDPRTAPPRPMATVTSIALSSRPAEPRDPAEAARLARGRDPMEGFYD